MKGYRFALASAFLLGAIGVHAETLSLEDALREAQKANPALLSARDAVQESDAELSVADAGFYPSLTADLGASTSQSLTNSASPSNPNYGASLNANWSLFNGFSTFASHNQSEAQLKAAQANYQLASSATLQSVWSAYTQLRFDELNGDLLENIRQRYHEDTAYEDLEFKSGQTARWTWLKSQSDESMVKWQEDQNTLNSKADLANLAGLLGRSHKDAQDLEVSDLSSAGPLSPSAAPPDDDSSGLAAVESLPAVIQAAQNLAASRAALDVTIATRYPSLSANAALGSSYDGASLGNADWYDYWSAGLTLSYNLFQGGANEGSIRAATAALASNQAALDAARLSAETNIAKAWASYYSNYQHLPLDAQATAAGSERYLTVSKLYEAGLAQYLDYEQAEQIYTQAQQSELQANLAAAQAQVAYENALGRTLEDELSESKP